jgi:hypothetical protein
LQRINDLFVVDFAAGVDGYVADQEILARADDVDTFDIAARAAYGSCYLTEFSGSVVYLYAQRQTVARVGCWRTCHVKKYDKKVYFEAN